jgi:hypothetical protein
MNLKRFDSKNESIISDRKRLKRSNKGIFESRSCKTIKKGKKDMKFREIAPL